MIGRRWASSSRWALRALAGALTLVGLLGIVSVGVGLRTGAPSGPLPASAPVDYAAGPFGSFGPLTSSFIRNVLGGVIQPPSDGPLSRGIGTPHGDGPTLGQRPRVYDTHPLTNDHRVSARKIPSVPFTARTNTREATRESAEPSQCGAIQGGSVWYRYTPPRDVGLLATTFGSNYTTTLGVFSGFNDDQGLGCDADVEGDAIVQFLARAGTTYLFQITGPAGGGDLVFNLDPEGVTTLVSASKNGAHGDASSRKPSISADGRLVAFESLAGNLTEDDVFSGANIYVRDRARGTTVLVSVSSSGEPANDHSEAAGPWISGNGRYVAFESMASNLVEGDTNEASDVFVRDLVLRRTERVSVDSAGRQLRRSTVAPNPAEGMVPSMSHDGRYVAFESGASNLVRGDDNDSIDVFVHDRITHRTERVSVDSAGREGNAASYVLSISGNGRFVAFNSTADNLTRDDRNESQDIFVHDRLTRTTERITNRPEQVNLEDTDQPSYPLGDLAVRQSMSFDGRYVTFTAAPRPTGQPVETHVFVYDRVRKRTVQADKSSAGERADGAFGSKAPAISSDGRYVAFFSFSDNLDPSDGNGATDIFLRDLETRTTIRITSVAARQDTCRDCGGFIPTVSADGRVVAFMSSLFNPLLRFAQSDLEQIYVNEQLRGR